MLHRIAGITLAGIVLLAGCTGTRQSPPADPVTEAAPFLPAVWAEGEAPDTIPLPLEVATLRLEPAGEAPDAPLIERRIVYDPRWVPAETVAWSRALLYEWLTGHAPRDDAFADLTPATFADRARGEALLLPLEKTNGAPWPDGVPAVWDYRLYVRRVGAGGLPAESQLIARALVRHRAGVIYRNPDGPVAWELGRVGTRRNAIYLDILTDFDPPDLTAPGVRGTLRTYALPLAGDSGLFSLVGDRRVDVRAYLNELGSGAGEATP